ncbi:hypothetical protein GJAV_G00027250 [Gymnothorax javanicus]|nr:hypothetical protein GJAV_G00027250 [Gymnothorax javanicus]
MDWLGDFPQDHASVDWGMWGLPGDLELQQLLRDTEEKLNLNALSIEHSLKELQVKSGESTPADCLQWFSPRNLTRLKPTCTGQQQLLDFLRALQQFLRTEASGRAEATLQLLLDISSQCGVAFPRPAPLTAGQLASDSPLHAVREETTLEVREVWEDIRLLLRRHLLDKLQSVADSEGDGSKCLVFQRIQSLQQLLFLYPEEEVLSRYRSVRIKAVQDILQNALSFSPAEMGFDKVASGFQTVCPVLLSLLREDLQVLSAVADPAAFLAFANHAHLGTVVRELRVVMEKLVENMAKDNSASSSKTRRKPSAKSKVAVAPQEDSPRSPRSFCITSQQLRQLALLTGALLDLEQGMEALATTLGVLSSAEEPPCGVRGILKKPSDDPETTLPESSRSASEISPQVPETSALEFDWRAAFSELAPPMVHCVRAVLEEACTRSLQQEEVVHTSGSAHLLVLAEVPWAEGPPTSSPEREPPKMIAKFVADTLEELEALFPLALAFRQDSLLDVCASFIEGVSRAASAILGRLQERGSEVPSSAPVQNLPALLATGVYLQQWLTHYQAQLKNPPPKSLSLLPIQRCQELTEVLRDHLTGYCIQTCTTCVLHDAESHHWADPKPFYEGERCSFSIQMWHYFLSGLRSDLWAVLPSSLAQDVLAQVLSQTLEVLVQRYSRARPSFKRTQQVRTDITAILLCVKELMWSVCSSARFLVQQDTWDRPWVSSIHSLCEQLLGVLAIVTSPLPALCTNFCGDSADGPSSSQTKESCSKKAQWLRHIDPLIFSKQSQRLSEAADLATVGLLRLACAQPDCSFTLLLQLLLQSDCALLRTLLSHTSLSGPCEDQVAYFDKRSLWDHLYNLQDSSQAEPAVLRCLRTTLTESISNIVDNIVTMVTSWQASEAHSLSTQVIPESVLSKVPKEWNYMSQNTPKEESSNDYTKLLVHTVSFVFINLPTVVANLPLSVRIFFYAGEKRLSQTSQQLNPMGLLLWALLGLLCQSLQDRDSLEGPAHGDVEKMGLVVDCLRAAMGQQTGVPKPVVQKALETLDEARPKWRSTQLQKARALCTEGAFEVAECGSAPESDGVLEPTEQKIGLMVLEICHKAGGGEYLRQIYHIIRLNEELLASLLSALTDSAQTSPEAPAMTLTPGPAGPRPPFNPIAQFNHIGAKEFDQSAISEWSWDWAQVLPTYQRMSQVTLRTLLANRWDLQDGAAIEDEERALADLVRKTYFSSSPGS